MERVLLDEVIFTDYGQFDLIWAHGAGFDGDFNRYFTGQDNGLVGAADPDGVYLILGRRSGGSPVRIVLVDTAPGEPDASWEDVVEVSFTVPEAGEFKNTNWYNSTVMWTTWAGVNGGPLDGLGTGTYRMRVSARGRDAGSDGEQAEEPVDFYLAQLWLAPEEPDAVLRVGSSDAAYWHAEVQTRATTRSRARFGSSGWPSASTRQACGFPM
jgi:hypothetical protein